MASFARLATVEASSSRVGAVADGLEPDATEHLESFMCLPLMPVDSDTAQGLEELGFRELLQTAVEGGLDIREGDNLVIWSDDLEADVIYPIRAVADWPWSPTGEARLILYLEDQK